MELIIKRGVKRILLLAMAFLYRHPRLHVMVRLIIDGSGLGVLARRIHCRLNGATSFSRYTAWSGMASNTLPLSNRALKIYDDLKSAVENGIKGVS